MNDLKKVSNKLLEIDSLFSEMSLDEAGKLADELRKENIDVWTLRKIGLGLKSITESTIKR